MSKHTSRLAKGLAVGTLAAGIAVLSGASPVSASAYYNDNWMPKFKNHFSYRDNNVHFNEKHDKAASFFYHLKEDEKKHSNEHFSYNDNRYDYNNGKHGYNKHGYNKHDGKHDDKHNKKYGKHGCDCQGWGGYGSGNHVSINYHRDDSYTKKFEELKAKQSKESYASNFHQSHNQGNTGYGKHGRADYANHSVSASLNYNKEHSYLSHVKAEVAQSSSVSTSVNLANYNHGPRGGSGHSNSVSAYENFDHYNKVEAKVAEHYKEQSSVNYNADNSRANYGGYGGYANLANSNVSYSAHNSVESSREVSYKAEEKTSYSSGYNANNSFYDYGKDGYGAKHQLASYGGHKDGGYNN